VANPLLTWESQENFNVGLDFAVLNNKISGTVEYFVRTSSDLILDRPISYTTGFRNVSQNVGDMQNSGIELSLNADILDKGDFSLNVGGNITFLKNEITDLPEPFVDGTKRREQGRDFQEYFLFGWAGVNPDNGAPLWYVSS